MLILEDTWITLLVDTNFVEYVFNSSLQEEIDSEERLVRYTRGYS